MNEHDASNSNATLVNNCKSRNVPFSHMHYTMHIISIKKFIFENLIFQNFVSFYFILFFKFFFPKFTVHSLTVDHYCSQLTVDHYCLQLTVDRYCSSQYNNCIAIQFSAPQAFSSNTIFPLHTFILQYNFSTVHFYIAIQFSAHCTTILQYNAIPCNTIPQPTCKPHCNTIPCIAIQFSSP